MKKKLVKAGAIILSLPLVLLLLAAVAVNLFIDEAWLEEKIITAMGQREVKIESFDLRLLPPRVRLENIVIGNPEGFAEEQLLSAELLKVRLSAIPLIYGVMAIEEVHLDGLNINLIRDAQGRENWTGQARQEAAPEQQQQQQPREWKGIPSILLNQADILQFSFLWQDLQDNKTVAVNNLNLAWHTAAAEFPLQAYWEFEAGPDIATATARMRSNAVFGNNIARLEQFQVEADINSSYLEGGQGNLILTATPEFDTGDGAIRTGETSLKMPGVKLDTTVELDSEKLMASLALDIARLSEAVAITGMGSVLDELGITEGLSGPVSLQLPELEVGLLDGTLALGNFNLNGVGINLAADIAISGLDRERKIPDNADIKVNGTIDDVSLFWKLAAAIQPGNSERWHRLAEAYKTASRRTATMNIDLSLADKVIAATTAEFTAMGIKAQSDGLRIDANNNYNTGTLDIKVSEPDRLLTAWLGAETRWAGHVADIAVKTDLSGDEQLLQINLDLLDRLSVPRRFALKAPAKIDAASNSIAVPQLSLTGPGLHLGGSMDIQLAKTSGTARIEIVKADPRSVIDMFIDLRQADNNLLRKLEGRMMLDFSPTEHRIQVQDAALDETSIAGTITGKDGSTDFDLELGRLVLDSYIPAKKEEQSTAINPITTEDQPILSNTAQKNIATMNIKGKVAIEELVVRKLKLTELKLSMEAHNGKLEADVQGKTYGGKSKVKVAIDTETKPAATITADTAISGIELEPLLTDITDKDLAQGRMDMSINVNSINGTTKELMANLNGNADIKADKVSFPYIDLVNKIKNISDISQLISFGSEEGEGTSFSSIAATAQIAEGIVTNNDLKASSPVVTITGSGTHNLPENNIDYELTMNFDQDNEETASLAGLKLPVRIEGQLPKPSYSVDMSAVGVDDLAKMLPGLAKEGIGGVAGGLIDKITGGGDDNGEEKEGKEEGEEDTEKEDPEEIIKDKAIDAVKKLLPF